MAITTESMKLHARAIRVMPGGNTRSTVFRLPYPIYADSGSGPIVTDVDGVQRLDFLNNYTVLIHGNAHPAIVKAVSEQLSRGTCFGLSTREEIMLAELLCSRVRSFERLRFTNSGSEAVMMAIKAARAFTGRSKIAKCEGSYHGSYDFAEVSLDSPPEGWADEPKSVPYALGTPEGVLRDVIVLPFNDVARAEHILTRHSSELAAVLVDPLPNRAGLIPASAEFLRLLRDFANRSGAVLIFDEVISFRLDYGGAQRVFGVDPDLTTLGKAIGGGFPIGCVAGKERIMAVFDPTHGKAPVPHAGTFNANPISMVAGLATMELLTANAFRQLNTLGDFARSEIERTFNAAGVDGQVTGMGSLFRLHFTRREITGYRTAYPIAIERRHLAEVYEFLLDHGILIASYGVGSLSTAVTMEHVRQFTATLYQALKNLGQKSKSVGLP